ncbi:MAG: PAS domain-containing protein [Sulfuricella sp.]|nr:PAS domain-containing protein [Sulfuricella sp.]
MATQKHHDKIPPTPTAPPNGEAFPIVGIGASAGGLEAFEQFFRHTPADSGMAFIVVSHLDPGHASILTEILQRATAMPVVEAQDQMAVAPDAVYVIPPNRDMAIFHGKLQLSEPEQPRGQRMPIDAFLRSLAADQGERAVGIILSGTGSDGTLGLRAILGGGGISLVQEPTTAKFDGMPSSAIQAGYVSHVLPVEKMPEALLAGMRTLAIRQEQIQPAAASAMNRILMLLRASTGNDFSLYKKSTIGRRIERRMAQHNIDDLGVYARYLKERPAEIHTLFKELLINVTSFFRDPEAFVVLKQEILPQLLNDKPEDYLFRVWVCGCASGEEAYSIAILLREYMDETGREFKVQLYATDLDDDAIAVARAGAYPANIAQDVTPERLRRFFNKDEAGWRVKKEIREMVVFAIQNVVKDPPFTRLDLLSCRNLMIYLEPELQNRLLPAFHYALKPGGMLFLSPSESTGNYPELFAAQNRKWKFYRAIHTTTSTHAVMSSGLTWAAESNARATGEVAKKSAGANLAELTKRALLQTYAPASLLTDAKGDILYVHGDTGRYLRPAPGQPTLNAIEMARDGLPLELRAALRNAGELGVSTLEQELPVKTNGGFSTVALSVRPVASEGLNLMLVSFQDVAHATPKPRAKRSSSATTGRIEELERELTYTRESLQATIEEQQASNEELKSANEEMQSTNEELQSTNEELETSKEELQSVNEELITVNAELQAKIEQLAGMQNDMKNLLDNINVGTIFLDQELVIKRFTREAARVYRLVGSDVGRPLADIKTDLDGDDLIARSRVVLDTLVPYERELCGVGGIYYLARIQPYRTVDNMIDGVVLTFADITERIAAIADREARELAEAIVDAVREPLVVLDKDLNVVSASRSFYQRFQIAAQETLGQPLYALCNRQWDAPALRELLESILPDGQAFEDYAIEVDLPATGRCKLLLNARRIVGKGGATQLILLAMDEAESE